MAKPVYVVVVLKPSEPGSPHVVGPFESHAAAGAAADTYLTRVRGKAQAFVRSLYEPGVLNMFHSGDKRRTRRSR
jgi:hypothetical protein